MFVIFRRVVYAYLLVHSLMRLPFLYFPLSASFPFSFSPEPSGEITLCVSTPRVQLTSPSFLPFASKQQIMSQYTQGIDRDSAAKSLPAKLVFGLFLLVSKAVSALSRNATLNHIRPPPAFLAPPFNQSIYYPPFFFLLLTLASVPYSICEVL